MSVFNFYSSFSMEGFLVTIGGMISIAIPLIIALLIARFRSFFASLWFIMFIVIGLNFLIDSVSPIKSFFTDPNNPFVIGFYGGFSLLAISCITFHTGLVTLLSYISSNSTYNSIISSNLFPVILYSVLFLLSFIIFHKRKSRRSSRYNDDF